MRAEIGMFFTLAAAGICAVAVNADTETAVAKLYNLLFKSIAKIQRLTRFQQHEIVA